MSVLDVWTIYDHPIDFPNHYIARLHKIENGECNATSEYIKHKSLDALRAMLPNSLNCVGRSDNDLPHIIESWL